MFPVWQKEQQLKYIDAFHTEWDIFGLEGWKSSYKLTKIDTRDVLTWLNRQSTKEDENHTQHIVAGPDSKKKVTLLYMDSLLLEDKANQASFTRHRNYMNHEIKPWYMAFKHNIFAEISRALHLPETYLFMRAEAGGAGNYAKYSSFNNDGSLSRIGFVFRVPHSPRSNEKAIWSLAISWSSSTGHSSGLWEGVSNADIQEISDYLTTKESHSGHPISIPTMLLDMLMVHYASHRRKLVSSLFLLETQLGITRGARKTDAWDWNYNIFRKFTKQCNGTYTDLVYLERRLQFGSGLGKFLLSCLGFLEEEKIMSVEQSSKLQGISRMMKENIQNNEAFFETQLQHVLCLQKRCQALITVIYSVVAQKDSRINLQIAKAAKRDSSSMTALAVLGIVFLPAMLIASIFSTSMFDFSSSSDRGPTLSPSFWMYWAVTVPLTLVILGGWKAHMYMQNTYEKGSDESGPTEEQTFEAIKTMYQSNLSTPFYHKKGQGGYQIT